MQVRQVQQEEIYPVRAVVLRPGQQLESAIFPGDDHPEAVHMGAFDRERLVGVGTVFPGDPVEGFPDPVWRMRGMAVLPEFQSNGVGALIIAELVKAVEMRGGGCIWGWAREAAHNFYLRNGFEDTGENKDFPGIGFHYRMIHRF